MSIKKVKLVIVGGGFGGVAAAHKLADDDRFDITIISDRDYFCYYPTLYLTATGALTRESIVPLKEVFKDTAVKIVHNKAISIDRAKKQIVCRNHKVYGYDELVLALGVTTNYFGIEGLAQYSFGIKSREEVEAFKKHVKEKIKSDKRQDHNYIVVGGGPTGIELAGALPHYIEQLADDANKTINYSVTIVEAAPRLSPRSSKITSKAIERRLKKLGVIIRTNAHVQGETAGTLTIDGERIHSTCVVWTAGIAMNSFYAENNFEMHRRHVAVNAYLEAEDSVYVLGDNADTPYSGMAQTAMYDGTFVAENLIRKVSGQDMKSYSVKKPVYATPVGAGWAALSYGKVEIFGRISWILRKIADTKAKLTLF